MRAPARPARASTFASLRIRNFRLFIIGQLVSSVGTWLHQVAETWLMFEVTGNGFAVGLVVLARFAPVLTLGPWGGALADRLDKRTLLYSTQSVRGLTAVALGILALAGQASALVILALAFVSGCANAIDNPVRRALIGDLVDDDHLLNAVSLNSTVMATSRVVGPLVAGLLIATVGVAWCFVVNGVSYIAVLFALAAMRIASARGRVRRDLGPRPVRAGLRHAAADPSIWVPLVMVGLVSASAWNWETLLALHAAETFGANATLFTVMFTLLSAGTLVGAMVNARRRHVDHRTLVTTAGAVGVVMLAVAVVPGLPLALVLLPLCGVGIAMFNTASNALLQRASRGDFHGRVMAIFSTLFVGAKGVGGLVAGGVAATLGPRAGIAVGGCGCIGAACAGMMLASRPGRAPGDQPLAAED